MAEVILLSGSPTEPSRTDAVLDQIAAGLERDGHVTDSIRLRDLPAEPLLRAQNDDPEVSDAITKILSSEAVVIGSPVYKATYSGLLKSFMDLLPMNALTDTAVLPVLTGGSFAHVLALDYGLKPLLSTLGATTITAGRFIHSPTITIDTQTQPPALTADTQRELHEMVSCFNARLSHTRTHPPATRQIEREARYA